VNGGDCLKNEQFLGGVYLTVAASIWGGMYVVSKYVLVYIPPMTLVWVRYMIAFAVLFIILLFSSKKPSIKSITKRDWLLIFWVGFIGYFVSISFQFIGTKLSDAHTGALLTSATPAFIVIFAKFILKETITKQKLIALTFASVGVIIVIGWEYEATQYLMGSFILVGAALTWALLSIYAKIAVQKIGSTLFLTTFAIFFAIILTTPFMVVEQTSYNYESISILVILGILYLGTISTAGAFFLWNKGLTMMDASIGSLFFFFQPIVGTFFGWLLLKEQLSLGFFTGGIFIVIGVSIAVHSDKNRRKKTLP
jgi:drug/metabolite transporter (DMT)-like permease